MSYQNYLEKRLNENQDLEIEDEDIDEITGQTVNLIFKLMDPEGKSKGNFSLNSSKDLRNAIKQAIENWKEDNLGSDEDQGMRDQEGDEQMYGSGE